MRLQDFQALIDAMEARRLRALSMHVDADIWANGWVPNQEGWWVHQDVPGCVSQEPDGRFHAFLHRQLPPGDFVADTCKAATNWLEQQAAAKGGDDAG